MSLFQPQEDACNYCESFNAHNLSNEEYQAHILSKNEAMVENDLDKENPKCVTFMIDLQSLLLFPRSNVSALLLQNEVVYSQFHNIQSGYEGRFMIHMK